MVSGGASEYAENWGETLNPDLEMLFAPRFVISNQRAGRSVLYRWLLYVNVEWY